MCPVLIPSHAVALTELTPQAKKSRAWVETDVVVDEWEGLMEVRVIADFRLLRRLNIFQSREKTALYQYITVKPEESIKLFPVNNLIKLSLSTTHLSTMCRLCGRVVRCIFDSMPSRKLISSAPRAHLFTQRRAYSVSAPRFADEKSLFNRGPAPPRLPREEQDLFEKLQAQSTGAFSTPRASPRINQSPDSSVVEKAQAETEINDRVSGLTVEEQAQSKTQGEFQEDYKKIIEARGKGEELHPNVRRGAEPEFEGEVNPKTGEVGGPRNEPLRWGAAGEWSYNGRTTDF